MYEVVPLERIHVLAVPGVVLVLSVLFPGGRYLLLAGRNLEPHGTLVGARPVLEGHAGVAEVGVLEGYDLVA